MATNQPAAVSNLITQTTGVKVSVPDTSDPVEMEYQKIMAEDDAAQMEVDKWIRDAREFAVKGAPAPGDQLQLRIRARLDNVKELYNAFLKKNPAHAKARLAYGSFLNDIGEDAAGALEWEKAKEIEPNNPAAWNNLANYYGHRSPVKKAFEYYAKAIELDSKEAVYYHNFGTTVFLFRKDAMEFYNINEQQVFDKALALYDKALQLEPNDFLLAHDIAQTYYGIKPARTEEALKAWRYALGVARDDIERQGVYLHLARFEMQAGRFDQARKNISMVTHEMYGELKGRVTETLRKKESPDAPAPATSQAPR